MTYNEWLSLDVDFKMDNEIFILEYSHRLAQFRENYYEVHSQIDKHWKRIDIIKGCDLSDKFMRAWYDHYYYGPDGFHWKVPGYNAVKFQWEYFKIFKTIIDI